MKQRLSSALGDPDRYFPMARVFLIPLIALSLGCTDNSDGLNLSDHSTGQAPANSTDSFRVVVSDLIEAKRYRDAVDYLKNGDAQLQANYDKTGFLAVGEDLIVLPGVFSEHDYDHDRDWLIPGTSDAIEDEAWQETATEFAKRYNQLRIRK